MRYCRFDRCVYQVVYRCQLGFGCRNGHHRMACYDVNCDFFASLFHTLLHFLHFFSWLFYVWYYFFVHVQVLGTTPVLELHVSYTKLFVCSFMFNLLYVASVNYKTIKCVNYISQKLLLINTYRNITIVYLNAWYCFNLYY